MISKFSWDKINRISRRNKTKKGPTGKWGGLSLELGRTGPLGQASHPGPREQEKKERKGCYRFQGKKESIELKYLRHEGESSTSQKKNQGSFAKMNSTFQVQDRTAFSVNEPSYQGLDGNSTNKVRAKQQYRRYSREEKDERPYSL